MKHISNMYYHVTLTPLLPLFVKKEQTMKINEHPPENCVYLIKRL